MTKKIEKRIPYDVWANSQLSIAKFYGVCVINGETYIFPYENCKTIGEGKNKKYFPDLVLIKKKIH